jgi:broad specificity phosphatase PhoE
MHMFGSYLPLIIGPLLLLVAVLLVALALLGVKRRRFYFLRHGETLLNAEHIRQGRDGALSPKGRAQAEQAGAYLSRFPITSIIASTYPRALETAEIIAKHVNVSVTPSELFIERRNPSEIIGKPTQDPDVVRIVDRIDLSFHEDDFRYSDEENFSDLKARARKCLALLSHQGSGDVAIVTHHAFLKMCLAYLLYRDDLHAADFVKLAFFNDSDNGCISICEYNPWKVFSKTRGWSIIAYNEEP